MMKKQHLVKSLLCLVLIIAFCTGCGLGTEWDNPGAQVGNEPTSGSSGTTDPSNGSEDPGGNGGTETVDPSTPYTVSVYYNGVLYSPGDNEVKVIWHGESGNVVVPLGQDGTANAGVLDGDYDITLSGLPDTYTYNPNGYHVTANERTAMIFLYTLTEPNSGNGGVDATEEMAKYNPYVITKEGTYRVTCEYAGQKFYFRFTPSKGGKYDIVSWCDIYEDVVNPMVDIYGGTLAYLWLEETVDTGGATQDGGYTKNFYYQIGMSTASVGNSYTFCVYGYSKTGEYPITIDFNLTRVGDYNSASEVEEDPADTIRTELYGDEDSATRKAFEGTLKKWAQKGTVPEITGTFHWINELSEDGMTFNDAYVRIKDGEYYYRLYDEEKYADNDGWGPALVCDLMNVLPSCAGHEVLSSLYSADAVTSGRNWLELRLWRDAVYDSEGNCIQEAGYVTVNYKSLIKNTYGALCNQCEGHDDDEWCSQCGKCYVTEELRYFLQLFAENKSFWTDGISPTQGTPEANGYIADQDSLWLFACGFYEDAR